MSCQNIIKAAQRLREWMEACVLSEEPPAVALWNALDTYLIEKHFVSGQHVFEEYIPGYERPPVITNWPNI